ncbi:hypothetical protein AOLI_G00094790 [Acnodon oligacanthus]
MVELGSGSVKGRWRAETRCSSYSCRKKKTEREEESGSLYDLIYTARFKISAEVGTFRVGCNEIRRPCFTVADLKLGEITGRHINFGLTLWMLPRQCCPGQRGGRHVSVRDIH